jgi:hypothetical protein
LAYPKKVVINPKITFLRLARDHQPLPFNLNLLPCTPQEGIKKNALRPVPDFLVTYLLTSAFKEVISCTLARKMIVYSLPANHQKNKHIRISGVFICRR